MLPTLPTSHGPAGIKWQIEWERVGKRVGATHGKVSCKGSGSRQKTLAPQCPRLVLISHTAPRTLHCAWHQESMEYLFVE